jgi:RNA polymerase sigma factor (TIGR02999 family)
MALSANSTDEGCSLSLLHTGVFMQPTSADPPESDAVTRFRTAAEKGEPQRSEQLLPLVYEELRRLARARLAAESSGQTLQATALVHEAYLRLVGSDPGVAWDCRGHFFAAAAEAMRRILVERARRKRRVRHGGGRGRIDLDEVASVGDERLDELLALHEALDQLADEEPVVAEVVKLRYFAGLTTEQAALALDVSLRTANRHWAFARAWLYQRLNKAGDAPV